MLKSFKAPHHAIALWQFYESGIYVSETHQTLGGIEKGDCGERGAVLVYFIGRGINLYVLSHDEHTIWEIAVAHFGARAFGSDIVEKYQQLEK